MKYGTSYETDTSASLLNRVRDLSNQEDWERFIAIYGPFLLRFLLRRGLTREDAQDVVQETFVAVVDHIGDFQYDPAKRFRSWLATVALRKAWRYLNRMHREPMGVGGSTHMEKIAAVIDHAFCGGDESDRLEMVLDRVRAEVPPLQWEAFRLTVLENMSSIAAAEYLDIDIGHLYVCRSRAKHVLRRILERVDE